MRCRSCCDLTNRQTEGNCARDQAVRCTCMSSTSYRSSDTIHSTIIRRLHTCEDIKFLCVDVWCLCSKYKGVEICRFSTSTLFRLFWCEWEPCDGEHVMESKPKKPVAAITQPGQNRTSTNNSFQMLLFRIFSLSSFLLKYTLLSFYILNQNRPRSLWSSIFCSNKKQFVVFHLFPSGDFFSTTFECQWIPADSLCWNSPWMHSECIIPASSIHATESDFKSFSSSSYDSSSS